ncbi:hypothetical protein RCM15_02560 [Escherichia coli]|nr:hypothetical protein [Escherichia coli]
MSEWAFPACWEGVRKSGIDVRHDENEKIALRKFASKNTYMVFTLKNNTYIIW